MTHGISHALPDCRSIRLALRVRFATKPPPYRPQKHTLAERRHMPESDTARDAPLPAPTRQTPAHPAACGCDHHPGQNGDHRCACRALRTPRRLHAAGGALFGLFAIVHFGVNATGGHPKTFARLVGTIHAMIDAVPGLTIAFVFLPLLMQIGSGLYLLYKDGLRYRPKGCNRGSTPRFFLQRATAIIVLAFVCLHLGTLHGWGLHPVPRTATGALAGYDPTHIFPAFGWAGALAFLLAVWSLSFHLANGAISGAHVWGVVSSDAGKRGWRRICATFGAFAALTSTTAWLAFGCIGLIR